jgi:hypothetical protein
MKRTRVSIIALFLRSTGILLEAVFFLIGSGQVAFSLFFADHLFMSRVGFLWDSLSANTGDQAIGLTFLRLANSAGLQRVLPVSIGEPLAGQYDLLIIGGGELLHPAGHAFYDIFRVPGEHILNTVGAYGEVEANYLSSYRLVTVRSVEDSRNLRGVNREVSVAPCLSVLFDGLVEDQPVAMPRNALLIHVHAGAFPPGDARAAIRILRKLPHRVAFLPFTHYNCDSILQSVLADASGNAPPLAVSGADQAFSAMRRARAAIVASLHATIFAYVAGIPFLAIPYHSKVRSFLADRGLEQRLLPDMLHLPEKLHLIDPVSVDWHARLAEDAASARATAEKILALAEEALVKSRGMRAPRVDWKEPSNPVQTHREMIGRHAEYGRLQALAVDFARKPEWEQWLINHARRFAGRLSGLQRFIRFLK